MKKLLVVILALMLMPICSFGNMVVNSGGGEAAAGGGSDWTSFDFTTFTEVDANTDITITSTQCSIDTMQKQYDSYVYKAQEETGVFKYRFEIYHDASESTSECALFMLANSYGSMDNGSDGDILDPREPVIAVSYGENKYSESSNYVALHSRNTANGLSTDIFQCLEDTLYYCELERTADSITLKIYSDSGYSSLVDTLSVTYLSDTLNYLHCCSNSYITNYFGTRYTTGYVQNMQRYNG